VRSAVGLGESFAGALLVIDYVAANPPQRLARELLRPPYPIVTAARCADPADLLLGLLVRPFPWLAIQGIAQDLLVFARRGLGEPCKKVFSVLGSRHPRHRAVASTPAASALARQIQQGAPADVFIGPPAAMWMDALENRRRTTPRRRRDSRAISWLLDCPRQRQPAGHAEPAFEFLSACCKASGSIWQLVDRGCLRHLGKGSALTSWRSVPGIRRMSPSPNNVRSNAEAGCPRVRRLWHWLRGTDAGAEPRSVFRCDLCESQPCAYCLSRRYSERQPLARSLPIFLSNLSGGQRARALFCRPMASRAGYCGLGN